MKNVVFLVDTGNSKFLVVNENKIWNLPTLMHVENLKNINKRFYKKYKININEDISIIEKNEKYIFVKCTTHNKNYDRTLFNADIINEIYNLITNKFHKQLLFNILIKIYFEMRNDSFWLGIILTVENNIKNEMMKALLSDFLLLFSSSFCEELIVYKFGKITNQNIISKKQLKEMRNNYFKLCPLYDSKHMKSIISEMEIDFDNYTFDNVLFYNDGELIDINIRTWKNRNNFDKYNGIILSPRRWIKNFHYEQNDMFEKLRVPYVNDLVNKFNKKNVVCKPYSSKKLFKNNLTNNDKIYIMQRIGLLKTIMLFSKVFGIGNRITDECGNDFVNFDKYILKVKATIIEMLWNDNCKNKNKIPFLSQILNNYPKEIPKNFFPINRKCRDNIHYGFYNEMSKDEIIILNQYQDIYLNYVISEFEKQLIPKFGVSYKIDLFLAKIQYWASH